MLGVCYWCVVTGSALENNQSPSLFQILCWYIVQKETGQNLKRVGHPYRALSGTRVNLNVSSVFADLWSYTERSYPALGRIITDGTTDEPAPGSYVIPVGTYPPICVTA
jgi:hypothetical protein